MGGHVPPADARASGIHAPKPGRLEARRDRDRILYSSEFRRLAGVTQVASAVEKLLIHNRITHSIKVEQVASGITSYVDATIGDPIFGAAGEWRVAAAGLGHDLGHPPFGHIGEETLHELVTCAEHRNSPRGSAERADKQRRCKGCLLEDGFEGNAQSFRIVTKLAVRKEEDPSATGDYRRGLDLTRGTLAALSKYPWLRGDQLGKPNKWGAYDCDRDQLSWVLAGSSDDQYTGSARSPALEAQVMDWADDITYAVHDLDDFFRLGLVPLDALRDTSSKEFRNFLAYAEKSVSEELYDGIDINELKDYVENRFELLPSRPFLGYPTDVASVGAVVSDLIDLFVSHTRVSDGKIDPDRRPKYLNEILKQLTWYYVIDNPSLSSIQFGQRRILRELFHAVMELCEDGYADPNPNQRARVKKQRRLPVLLKYFVNGAINDDGCKKAYGERRDSLLARGVIDFIASLTDLGAYKLHARLRGDADVSIMEPSIAF